MSSANESKRRAQCRQNARFKFFMLADGFRSFEDILQRIHRRWPVSCAGAEFAQELQRLYDQDQAERTELCRHYAREAFLRLRDPRMDFDALAARCARWDRMLARRPAFMAELRRLYDLDRSERCAAIGKAGQPGRRWRATPR